MVGSSSSDGDLKTTQFNCTNYYFWAVRMKTILIAHSLWDVVELDIHEQLILGEENSEEDEDDT